MTDHDSQDDHAAVPDAAYPPAAPDGAPDWFSGDFDDLLGGEAAVPVGDYGPPIPSRFPDARVVTRELRELERRVRARLTPAFPIERRRRLPFWRAYRDFALRNRSLHVDDYGRDPAYAARVEPVLDFLYRRYFRVTAEGVANLPAQGRAILVANHSGTLPYDAAMLMHAVPREHPAGRQVRVLLEDAVFHFPYLGVFLNRLGAVRACQENARRLLERDALVAVFPEGVKGMGKLYRDRYQLQRFGRGGFVKLALRTGAPIIPVAIVGAEETQPMLARVDGLVRSLGLPYLPITPTFPLLGPAGLLPLPSKWTLRFGAPIDLSEHGPEAADDRLLVSRLTSQTRSQLQEMIDSALAERESSAFG